MSLLKNYFNYIKDLISGEEYLTDRDKFTIMLHLCAAMHMISALLFLGFGSILLMLYNLLSFLIYESLVTMSKNKLFKTVVFISSVEVMVCVFLTTIGFGQLLNFNLYCILCMLQRKGFQASFACCGN